jgi:hypothetical protein
MKAGNGMNSALLSIKGEPGEEGRDKQKSSEETTEHKGQTTEQQDNNTQHRRWT